MRERANGLVQPAHELVQALEANADILDLDRSQAAGRLATARAAGRLVEQLARTRDSLSLVSLLAQAELPGEDQVAARSLQQAGAVAGTLAHTQWHLLQAIGSLGDERRERAGRILSDLAAVSRLDEFQRSLAPALGGAQRAAADLLAATPPPPSPTPATPPPPVPPPPTARPADHSTVVASSRVESVLPSLLTFAEEHPGERIRVSWEVEPGP